jgi:hypothetical protein
VKETFGYPLPHRITSYPSLVFLLALFIMLLVAPETLWRDDPDAGTRQAALAFVGLLIVATAAAAVRRLREPAEITLTSDGVHARRTIGDPVIVPYDAIEQISEYPRSFLRPVPELGIEGSGSSIRVNARIHQYMRLRQLVVERASPRATIDLLHPAGDEK